MKNEGENKKVIEETNGKNDIQVYLTGSDCIKKEIIQGKHT